ncbi:MAG: aldehyde ferredoxin oxidoreductase C-terminal domain-containing protein [Bacillota bacterium]
MEEPLKAGGSEGQFIPKEDLDLMLNEYYEARGWTKEGIPTEDKKKELDIG